MKNAKNVFKLFGFIALIAVIGFSIAACGGGADGGDPPPPVPKSVTYVSEDSSGNLYTLVITESTGRSARYTAKAGDSFTFKVELFNNGVYSVALLFSGTVGSVEDSGTDIEISLTVNGEALTITIEGAEMTVISGDIVDEDGDEVVATPEDLTPVAEAENWSTWALPGATATITRSVNKDDLCTITVGGTAMTTGDIWENIWKANASYQYTAEANKHYVFTFEAWTKTDTRGLNVQWYNNDPIYLSTGYQDNQTPNFSIDSTQKTYTLTTERIPRGGVRNLEFQCANQTGTFYVRILSVEAYDGIDDSADSRTAGQWNSWLHPTTTASIMYSVDAEDVCTITVGSTEQPNNATDDWGKWKADIAYAYTAKANAFYEFKLEAWTKSGTRNVDVQYYNDYWDGGETVLSIDSIAITSARTTYTVRGTTKIPKDSVEDLRFTCADQTGTFYVKIISITEYTP